MLPLFRDRRYLRVNGRPLLLVYKIADIPDVSAMVRIWRDACRCAGVDDPYLCAVQRRADDDPDAVRVRCRGRVSADRACCRERDPRIAGLRATFGGTVFRYANLAAHYLMLPRPPFPQFRGVTPMWDNTARRQDDAMIVTGSTPASFGVWLTNVLQQTRLRHDGEERLVFVNAWNEWAEGNHIEPDSMHGRGYLEALRAARRVEAEPLPDRPSLATIEHDLAAGMASGAIREAKFGRLRSLGSTEVAVVMPLYNHARYLERSLASLVAQTRLPDLLVVVDDGSTDGSAGDRRGVCDRCPIPGHVAAADECRCRSRAQSGHGAAGGGIIALLNSDDAFAPTRLGKLVGALGDGVDLAFSACEFIGDDDRPADGHYVRGLRERLDEAVRAPTLLHALVRYNVAVSTGNLVFRRALLSHIGGFAPQSPSATTGISCLRRLMRLALRSSRSPFIAIDSTTSNTFAGRRVAGVIEGEVALHGSSPTSQRTRGSMRMPDAAFVAFARDAGLAGYLRRASGSARA